MKFVRRDLGEAGEVSSGGGICGVLVETAKLSALGVALFAVLYFAIGWATGFVVSRLSVERERAIFSVLSHPEFASRPPERLAPVWGRVEAVLEQLRSAPEVPALDYELYYQDHPIANAVALPGGAIVLTRGLLEALADEDDDMALAFVIGHELGHFAHRDHLRSFGRAAGMRFALFLFFGGDLEAITTNATQLMMLHDSRADESAADLFSIECLRTVRGSSAGAEEFFASLLNEPQLPRWAYLFSTHPELEERIRAISDQTLPRTENR